MNSGCFRSKMQWNHKHLCCLIPACADHEDGVEPPYVDMIRAALTMLPGRQGNFPAVCAYIQVIVEDGYS